MFKKIGWVAAGSFVGFVGPHDLFAQSNACPQDCPTPSGISCAFLDKEEKEPCDDPGPCDLPKVKAAVEKKYGDWEKNVGRDFVPDRRPGYIIGLGVGAYSPNNPFGLAHGWQDCNDDGYLTYADAEGCHSYGQAANGTVDAMDGLLLHLNWAWDHGFRRIILNRPAGDWCPDCDRVVASSVWWTMPQWKRDEIETTLAIWIAQKKCCDPTFEIGVYCGLVIRNNNDPAEDGSPCVLETINPSPDGVESGVIVPEDFTIQRHMDVLLLNYGPWIAAGINALWFDNMSGPQYIPLGGCCDPLYYDANLKHIVSLQQSPDYYQIARMGWEAWPLDHTSCGTPTMSCPADGTWSGGLDVPDALNSTYAPFMQTEELFASTGLDPNGTWPSAWATAAPNMEYNLWFTRTPLYTTDSSTMAAYREHGINAWYQPGATPTALLPHMYGVYDFGTVCQADFNGDGCVNSVDISDFTTQWGIYSAGSGSGGLTFWEGDVNDDGLTNSVDVSTFYTAWFAVTGGSCVGCVCNCTGFEITLNGY